MRGTRLKWYDDMARLFPPNSPPATCMLRTFDKSFSPVRFHQRVDRAAHNSSVSSAAFPTAVDTDPGKDTGAKRLTSNKPVATAMDLFGVPILRGPRKQGTWTCSAIPHLQVKAVGRDRMIGLEHYEHHDKDRLLGASTTDLSGQYFIFWHTDILAKSVARDEAFSI